MINANHLCMECMKDTGGAEICPFCGFRDDGLQAAPYLPLKTWLMDRYLVGKVMTSDGEGVTYIGWDNISQAAVLIREFLPEGLCQRVAEGGVVRPVPEAAADYSQCLSSFLELWRALARMRDLSALFPVYDIFELGGTAYAIAEYTETITLEEFLHRNGNGLTFEQTRTLMMPAVSTLCALHSADLIHGGISPQTLYVGRDGKIRFGGFAGRELRTARGSLKTGLFPGYSAIEQYGFDGKVGPHTDVYAFAATVYRMIGGQAPADAKARMTQDTVVPALQLEGKIPEYAAEALANGLQLMPDSRTDSIERFREEFSAAPSVKEERMAQMEEISSDKEEEPKEKSKTGLYIVIAMIATLLVLAAIFVFVDLQWNVFGVLGGDDDKSEPTSLLVISSEPTPSKTTSETLTRKVPDFVGQTLKGSEANYSSYSFKVEYKVYNEQYDKGVIISQSPAPGTEFPLETNQAQTITVVVSLGTGQLQIPSVIGMTYAQAIQEMWKAGFSYDSITCNIDNPDFEGIVTKVSPGVGSSLNIYDAEIVLYVENPVESVVSIPEVSEDNREVESIAEPSVPATSKPAQ